jgi:hypothetical protein
MASAGAAAAAQIIQAVTAGGIIVRVEPDEFLKIVSKQPSLIVRAPYRFHFSSLRIQYMTSYRGLAFVTRCVEELRLPEGSEIVEAKTMSTMV